MDEEIGIRIGHPLDVLVGVRPTSIDHCLKHVRVSQARQVMLQPPALRQQVQ